MEAPISDRIVRVKGQGQPRRRQRGVMSEDKHKRVLFIGAGFSVGLGYPTGQELMCRLVEYLQGKKTRSQKQRRFFNTLRSTKANRELAQEFLEIIDQVLKRYFSVRLQDIKDVNIAEFFTVAQTITETPTLLETQSPKPSGPVIPTKNFFRSTFYDVLAAATRTYFYDICSTGDIGRPPADIASVLKRAKPKSDAIVSFNWDEEVEVYLTEVRDLDVSYNLPHWKKRGGLLILKPHGSIGWYDVRQGMSNKEAYFISEDDDRIQAADKRIISYYELEMPRTLDKKNDYPALSCPPVITPPTFAKRFTYQEQHSVWRDILEVCREASEFVFLGYSLPPDDFLTRAAIRSAFLHRKLQRLCCLIVNNDPKDPLLSFQSLFQNELDIDRNFLPWKFGSQDASLQGKIEEKLKKADLRIVSKA